MQVFSIFEHSPSLELAITKLEQEGVTKKNIFAIPINESDETLKIFDSIHDADGFSFLDKSLALAVATGVVGTSLGFNLTWGPIIWGLIAAFIGFSIGFLWNICVIKLTKNSRRTERKILPLVILVVECEKENVKSVEFILKEHKALGVNTPHLNDDENF
ncbi:hypothetical protein [Ornithinibacillus bavariensis]|uniref:DUF1269 domain-containing protein n=1 Tax=Ornithinibacillus bavariensis TaxID=545502 RepID=A0A919XBN2_9BACI|nr:hypothetical protein [Ornithinibacillus bavariensis]GIO27710.1 hypothetical protein J43TS3_23210 [Ornithinibacillus bavariensis]